MNRPELNGYARYAVYFAPPRASELSLRGAAWLGWDAEAGAAPPADGPDALMAEREALTLKPRRYGLHATLKAPFRLAAGVTPAEADAAVAALAAARAPAEGPGLTVDHGLGFVALVPSGPAPEIDALAAACVTELDALRAPPTDAASARRREAGLDPQAERHLAAWGYPHVLDRFRFHITLSAGLAPARAGPAAEALAAFFAPALEPRLRIAEIALFGDPGGGAPFRLLRRHPLGG